MAIRPTRLLHLILRDHISLGDTVIDATAGNGHDTVFLAEAVGPSGKVIAIDIQQAAIDATCQRLHDLSLHERVALHKASHDHLLRFAQAQTASAVVFNLGYLPGTNHTLITTPATTIAALTAALEILHPHGLLAVVCYPGHEGGKTEADAVEHFLKNLPAHRTARYQILHTAKPAPYLLITQKIPDHMARRNRLRSPN